MPTEDKCVGTKRHSVCERTKVGSALLALHGGGASEELGAVADLDTDVRHAVCVVPYGSDGLLVLHKVVDIGHHLGVQAEVLRSAATGDHEAVIAVDKVRPRVRRELMKR